MQHALPCTCTLPKVFRSDSGSGPGPLLKTKVIFVFLLQENFHFDDENFQQLILIRLDIP